MPYRVRVDGLAGIVIECDTADEVERLVRVLNRARWRTTELPADASRPVFFVATPPEIKVHSAAMQQEKLG